MLTNIDRVAIQVSNQRAALNFYVEKLGFELRHCTMGELYGEYDIHVGLPGSPTTLVLALPDARIGSWKARIMLTCTDLRKTYEYLREKGVEFTMHPIGGLEWVSFVDPDGNIFHVSDNNENWINKEALQRLMDSSQDTP